MKPNRGLELNGQPWMGKFSFGGLIYMVGRKTKHGVKEIIRWAAHLCRTSESFDFVDSAP